MVAALWESAIGDRPYYLPNVQDRPYDRLQHTNLGDAAIYLSDTEASRHGFPT